MRSRKIPLEDRVNTVIARATGISYVDVLTTFSITPNRFVWDVKEALAHRGDVSDPFKQKILDNLVSNPDKKAELFDMGEEFVVAQYERIHGRIPGECQNLFYKGTVRNLSNVKNLVYHALTYHHPDLKSPHREEVIATIKNLPWRLFAHFRELGLGGLMRQAFEKGQQDSPLAVLEVFDAAYREKTGDASLFDLTQSQHLHRWGDSFRALHQYWRSRSNVKEAVYHTLTEVHPELASSDRGTVIDVIKSFPFSLRKYFQSMGLRAVMWCGLSQEKKDSPGAILEVFDEAYREKTEDHSLFDLDITPHLHRWCESFKVSQRYWQNPANIAEAVYHGLVEAHPKLESPNRETVIAEVGTLFPNFRDHLQALGFRGLMTNGLSSPNKDSPLTVLRIFDQEYQLRTGQPSLFDSSQPFYVGVTPRNRIRIAA